MGKTCSEWMGRKSKGKDLAGKTARTQAVSADLTLRLPDEVLLKVLAFLCRSSLLSACLACSRWRRLGEEPALWATSTFTLDSTSLAGFLQHSGSPKVQRLRIDFGDDDDDFNYKKIRVGNFEVGRQVPSGGATWCHLGEQVVEELVMEELVAGELEVWEVARPWEKARPWETRREMRVKEGQGLVEVYEALAARGLQGRPLLSLYLGFFTSLRAVPPLTLARALMGVREVSIKATLSREQAVALACSWKGEEPAPHALYMRGQERVKALPAALLLPALARVAVIDLMEVKLDQAVSRAIFAAIGEGWEGARCAVRELNMSGNLLDRLEAATVVRAVRRLRVAKMVWCHLSREVAAALLLMLVEGDQGDLQELDIGGKEPALRGPGPEDSALVAIAMTRIPKLRF